MKVKLTNLRALQDTGEINIAPITVLLGKNSVGKSTFARSFSLMKQSLFINRSEPVLWYSPDLVDFGSFDESVTKDCEAIGFEYDFELSRVEFNFMLERSRFQFQNDLSFKLCKNFNKFLHLKFVIKKNRITEVKIDFLDFKYHIEYDSTVNNYSRYNVDSFTINGIKSNIKNLNCRDDFRRGEIIPSLSIKETIESNFNNFLFNNSHNVIIWDEILKSFSKIKDGRISDKTIKKILSSLTLGDYSNFKKDFEQEISNHKTISKKYQSLSLDKQSDFLTKLYNFIGEYFYNAVVDTINNYLSGYFSEVQYIAPIRATAERYYRIQGITLNEITSQGENVPMILYNMKPQDKLNWKKWTKENFNGIEFDVKKNSSNLSLTLSKSGEMINLADTGFGYSQILPILLYLWRRNRGNRNKFIRNRFYQSLLIIEQPELHLHPALQANLIDAFISIIKKENLGVSIIIETHSDTIVNRLGEHVISTNSKVEDTDINLIFFEEDEQKNGLAKLRQSKFDKKGRLKDWPIGFFEPDPIKPIQGEKNNVD